MMPGQLRSGVYEPVTPARLGLPPNFYVVCLTCGWAVDAFGSSALEALGSVVARHDRSHNLTARPVDYIDHALYKV
jgi:hypothetical protein